MKTLIRSVLIILISIFSVSCHKSTEPEPSVQTGTLSLHLHTNVDTNEVDTYGQIYTLTGGRKISVDSAQLYISNIQLIKLDNSTVGISSAILQVQDEESYSLGDVPAGNYKSISFHVGLDPTTNQKVPSNSSTDIFNKPGMWFGNSAQPNGFVFINFKGTIDTTASGNGSLSEMRPFNYKIGTDANYVQVVMPDQNYTVSPGQAQIIHIITDYNKLFTNFTFPLNATDRTILTPSDNDVTNKPIIGTIKNNIPLMFHYE